MAAVDDEERLRRRQQEIEDMLAAAEAAEEREREEQVPLLNQEPLPPPPAPARKRLNYVQTSFLAAGGLLYYALRTRQQWYLSMVYLSASKFSLVVFGNAVVAGSLALFDTMTATLLGGLRLQEAEGLQDFVRWNVTETCLALTMFRSELAVNTTLQFLAIIWIKCLHQVVILRENHLRLTEEALVASDWSPAIPTMPAGHVRVYVALVVLQLVDLWIVQITAEDLLKRGPSVNILFAFEAAILLVSAWSHILLFYLHLVDGFLHFVHERDYAMSKTWLHWWKEYKATLTFAVELQAQAVQFLFYLSFFAIVLTYYGMPINLFREVYVSFMQLKERVVAFLKYRRLMASMNRFDSVDEEKLEASGRVCIICRDEMTTADAKALPICEHLFHKSCLREWLVQQQSCPTCRADIAAMEAQQRTRRAAERAAEERREARGEGDDEEGQEQEEPPRPEASPRRHVVSTPGARREQTTEGRASNFDSLFFPAIYQVSTSIVSAPVFDEQGQLMRTIAPMHLVFVTDVRENDDNMVQFRVPDGWVPQEYLVHAADVDKID